MTPYEFSGQPVRFLTNVADWPNKGDKPTPFYDAGKPETEPELSVAHYEVPELREAKIILPVYDNDGDENNEVHKGLRRRLIDAFGGVTITEGEGAWCDGDGDVHEAAISYVVAVPLGSGDQIRHIAQWAGRALKQKSVYLVQRTGVVEIIYIKY